MAGPEATRGLGPVSCNHISQEGAHSMEVVLTAPEGSQEQTASGGADKGTVGDSAFDVVIIGAGPGGYATALYGAAAGLSMAMVELDKVGGTCLHRGCVPAKEFLETAAVYRTVSGSS